jgi:hypothetical protein
MQTFFFRCKQYLLSHKKLLSFSLLMLAILGTWAGVYLTQQKQIVQQKAAETPTIPFPVTVGMNYTHVSFDGCTLATGGAQLGYDNNGIVYAYHKPGVREKAKQELAQMKRSGIKSTDLVIWHMHDFYDAPATWGVIPSNNKRVDEPYRTNLINYLQDVTDAGFERIMITMGPQWRNTPGHYQGPEKYNPAFFDENWEFLKDVRSLVKQYGPKDSYFDLLGEGAPPNPDESRKQQMWEYDKKLWTNYVDEFGKEDAVISFIAPNPASPSGEVLWDSGALDNLYDIFEQSGKGQPNWYQLSFYPNKATYERSLQILNYIDQKLTSRGYTGPLIIREGWYNNADVAKAILEFNNTHARKVIEVHSWFIPYYDGFGDPNIDKLHCPVSPPYTQNEFVTKLPQRTATISASPNPCTVTESGLCTTALSWSVENPTSIVEIRVRESSGSGKLFAQGSKGTQEIPWVSTIPFFMDLYDGKTLLASIKIKGKGTLNASPNPCILSEQGTCTTKLSWNFGNAENVIVTVKENPGSLVARAPYGSKDIPWITTTGATFEIYSGSILLDTIFV